MATTEQLREAFHTTRKTTGVLVQNLIQSKFVNNGISHWVLGYIATPIEYGIRDVLHGERWGTTLRAQQLTVQDYEQTNRTLFLSYPKPDVAPPDPATVDSDIPSGNSTMSVPSLPSLPRTPTAETDTPAEPPGVWLQRHIQQATVRGVTLNYDNATTPTGKIWLTNPTTGVNPCVIEVVTPSEIEPSARRKIRIVNFAPGSMYREELVLPLDGGKAHGVHTSLRNPRDKNTFSLSDAATRFLTQQLSQALQCYPYWKTGLQAREEEGFVRNVSLALERTLYGRQPIPVNSVTFSPDTATVQIAHRPPISFQLFTFDGITHYVTLTHQDQQYIIDVRGRLVATSLPREEARQKLSYIYEALSLARLQDSPKTEHPLQRYLLQRVAIALGDAPVRETDAFIPNSDTFAYILGATERFVPPIQNEGLRRKIS